VAGDIARRLQGAVLRIRGDHPFFGTLALFAELKVSEEVETAQTDGKTLWFNPLFVDNLSSVQLCGLVVHELLHAALQHVVRRREREATLWNIAADIVVNGMIRSDTHYELPDGGVEDRELAHLSVEEIYEQLNTGKLPRPSIRLIDLGLSGLGEGDENGSLGDAQQDALQRHWRAALQQAGAVATRVGKGFGRQGLGGSREIESASQPVLSWREILWQFMVATPFDFGGFDRRFVHRKLYLEEMQGESFEVSIVIDTSGSIGEQELAVFRGEIQGILDAYPQIRGTLFFADASLYGPFQFSKDEPFPQAVGGGGTSFCPFFEWVNRQEREGNFPVCIYFTDGYGEFPKAAPESPVLWVVSSGGLESPRFPFGTVARIA
jgi:predicted metal-dependent peptidase